MDGRAKCSSAMADKAVGVRWKRQDSERLSLESERREEGAATPMRSYSGEGKAAAEGR